MKFNIELTSSKILAYLIFTVAIWGAIFFDDTSVLISGFEFAAIAISVKNVAQEATRYIDRRHKYNISEG